MSDSPRNPPPEDPVRARRYPHPGLGARPVVRLVGDAVAPATDAAMAYLGFSAPQVDEPLLTAKRRPLGYPAWALVNDPAHGREALAAQRELRQAAEQAEAKPKGAAEIYEAVGARLPVAHLPALYEQAARDYLDADRAPWAATFFGKAREAEQTHALSVDPTDRHMSYVEFAVAGAVTVKALRGYLAELTARHVPAEAYELYLDLALRRTRAGQAPWSQLPAQIAELAAAAGSDVDECRRDLVARLLRLPATRRAPSGFWTAVRPALARLAAVDPDARQRLVELFPAHDAWWWTFLGETGAVDAIRDVPGWLKRAHAHVKGDYRREGVPEGLLALIPRLAGRVTAPIDVVDWADQWGRLEPDLLEACLAAGIPVGAPAEPTYVDLWRDRHTDLSTMAGREEWRPLLLRSTRAFLRRESAAPLMRTEALRPFAHTVFRDWLAEAERGGLAAAADGIERLTRALSGVEPPRDVAATIGAFDLAGALARTLRAGILDEFGWPALEEAVGELKSVRGHSSSWPILTVWDAAQAIAVGPQGIVARFRFPSGPAGDGVAVLYSDGQFLVLDGQGWHSREAYWSGEPSARFTAPFLAHVHLGRGMLGPDGKRFTYGDPLSAGTRRFTDAQANSPTTFTDGESYWFVGPQGAPAPPFLTEAETPGGDKVYDWCSSLVRLPDDVDSPLSAEGSLAGAWVSSVPIWDESYSPGAGDVVATLGTVAGERVRVPVRRSDGWWPFQLIRFPAASGPQVLTRQANQIGLAVPESGDPLWRVDVGAGDGRTSRPCPAAGGTALVPPAEFWHFLRPRDEAGSAVLRSVTAATAAALLTETSNAKAAVERLIPGIADERLLQGVAAIVRHAWNLRDKRNKLAAVAANAGAVPAVDERLLDAALKNILDANWSVPRTSTTTQVHDISRVLTDPGGPEPRCFVDRDWPALIGRMEAVAWRAASPLLPPRQREALLVLLEVWAGTVFADPARPLHVERYGPVGGPKAGPGVRESGGVPYVRVGNTVLSTDPVPGLPPAERSHSAGPGWATAERLRGLVGRIRAEGPVPWDPGAAAVLASATGLSAPAAALLLAGDVPYGAYPSDRERDKAIRDTLGLKTAQARLAVDELRGLRGALLDAYVGALPEDPAELWRPGGTLRVAERLAERLVSLVGRRTAVPESTMETMARVEPQRGAVTDLLNRILAPESTPALVRDAPHRLDADGHVVCADPEIGTDQLDSMIGDLVRGVIIAYAYLPAGDPVRAAVPRLAGLLHDRLAYPELLVKGSHVYHEDGYRERLPDLFGAKPHIGRDGPVPDTADNGPGVLWWAAQGWTQLFVRPSLLDDGPASALVRAHVQGYNTPMAYVDLVKTEGFAAIADRIATGGLPDGAYEANPAVSAPGLVASAAGTLGVGADSAALYLQLLTLLDPTDRNVRRWNGWSPARHKKALAPLVSHGLLVEAKRARAGRSVFVPGGWSHSRHRNLPLETWKFPLYGMSVNPADPAGPPRSPLAWHLPLRPLPVLFAEAWSRRSEGDAPR